MKFNNNAIRELSYGALGRQAGAKDGFAWQRELKSRKSLLFAWQTELVNPKYLPTWARLKDADMECEIPWNSRNWQEFRERDWKRKTGHLINIRGHVFWSNKNTAPNLSAVPNQESTRELFASIVQTIPPTVFLWCETFLRLFPRFKDEGIFLIDRIFGLDILPGVLEFIIAEPFARASQCQDAPCKLNEIQSQIPEIEDYEDDINKGLRRRVLRHSPQEDNIWKLGEEVLDEYRDEFGIVLKEFEDDLAAEKSRLDKELQDAMKEYRANEQSEGI